MGDTSQDEDDILNLGLDEDLFYCDFVSQKTTEMAEEKDIINMVKNVQLLSGQANWDCWSKKMKVVFRRGDLEGVLNVEFDRTSAAAKKKDQLVFDLIVMSVSDDLQSRVHGTGGEAWRSLEDFCCPKTFEAQFRPLNDLQNNPISMSGDIRAHMCRVSKLFREAETAGFELADNLKIFFLFKSLGSDFQPIITSIGGWKTEATSLSSIEAKIIEQHDIAKAALERNNSGAPAALQANFNRNRLGPPVQHDRPRQAQQNEQQQRYTSRIICFKCGEFDHTARMCGNKRQGNDRQGHDRDRRDDHDRREGGNEGNKNGAKVARYSEDRVNEYREFYVKCLHSNSLKSFAGDISYFILDSGATVHCVHDKRMFDVIDETFREKIQTADGETKQAFGIGDVFVNISNSEGEVIKWRLTNVFYVPDFRFNLISANKLARSGVEVCYDENFCFIREKINPSKKLIIGKYESGSYILRSVKVEENSINILVARHRSYCVHEWHRILAHRNLADVKLLGEILKFRPCECEHDCESCIIGKMTRDSFPKKATPCTHPLEVVVSDLCGPMPTTSLGGARYLMTFIDVFTGFTYVYFLKSKDEAAQKVKNFMEMLKVQKGKVTKVFRCDRGTEYINNEVRVYLEENGILFQCTAGYSPEQNGVAEKKNRSLMEAARTMLIDQSLPDNLWAEAVNYANYVQNRLPYKAEKLIPLTEFSNSKPNYEFMFEFGKFVYVHVPKEKRKKLDPKAIKMRFMGYDFMSKGFRVYDGYHVRVSRDVNFMHSLINGKDFYDSTPKINHEKVESNDRSGNIDFMDLLDFHSRSEAQIVEENHPPPTPEIIANNNNNLSADDSNTGGADGEDEPAQVSIQRNPLNLSKIPRSTRFNGTYKGMVGSSTELTINDELFEPKTFKQATSCIESEKWSNAMLDEISSLDALNTWELTDLPPGKKAIGSKWVYKIKLDENGLAERYKARLVAKGFSQKYGEDYQEVFAPVGCPQSFRILLSVAAEKNYILNQFDVKTAFLNGILKEEIYLKQPEGFEVNCSQVYRLFKSIYGLKQAAREWNEILVTALSAAGAIQSENDQCLFTINTHNDVAYILIHVDDMLIAASNRDIIKHIERVFNQHFETKNLGEAKQFLGIKIEKIDGSYYISQPAYIEKIVKENKLSDSKSSFYPIDPGYYSLKGLNITNISEYRTIIGQVLYVANHTRPDISASVTILSRCLQNPRDCDITQAKSIVRYLNGTKHLKLKLNSTLENSALVAYCDADFAEDKTDRKSTTGFMVFVNGGLISWRSRKQSIVALSTAESEYIALSEVCQELAWLKRLCTDFGIVIIDPSQVFSDNQSAIALSTAECSNRTKYIDTKYHYVKWAVKWKRVFLEYKRTDENLADILTKPLNSTKIKVLRTASGLIEAEEEQGSASIDLEKEC